MEFQKIIEELKEAKKCLKKADEYTKKNIEKVCTLEHSELAAKTWDALWKIRSDIQKIELIDIDNLIKELEKQN